VQIALLCGLLRWSIARFCRTQSHVHGELFHGLRVAQTVAQVSKSGTSLVQAFLSRIAPTLDQRLHESVTALLVVAGEAESGLRAHRSAERGARLAV
jgi:hypothetical protein